MQKYYILIPVGIALIAIGLYIVSDPVKQLAPTLSWMEQQNALLPTNYPIGIGFMAVGFTCFYMMFILKREASKKKSRK